ncbi:hypothetical protein FQZ97_1047970 [compost metagenome]
MIRAVLVHTSRVSMNTLRDWTMPWAAGCFTSATAATLGALPRPASLENSPRLTPMMMAAPMPPAKAGSRPKALFTIRARVAGTSAMFMPTTSRAIRM